jgi:cytochrome P450
VDRLIDKALAQCAHDGGIDLVADFAAAVPVQLIGDMLGVPQDERGPLRGWSLAILGALEPVLTPEQFAHGVAAVRDFKVYLHDLVARRAHAPAGDDGDILSALIAGSEFAPADGGAGAEGRLSALELLHNCIFILNAGHETTTNLIGNGIDLLIRHPGSRRALREDPALIASAVEEFLRMESSNQLGNRRAARGTELGGVAMPKGTYVHIGIGAANRDPTQFPDPDRLDLARSPNRHLAFGAGIHACAAMSLARMEGQVAIGRLVARCGTIARVGPPVRSGRARFRGFLRYPVRLAERFA